MKELEVKKMIMLNNFAIFVAILGLLSCYGRFHGYIFLITIQIIIGIFITISLKSITNNKIQNRIFFFWRFLACYIVLLFIIYINRKNLSRYLINDIFTGILIEFIPIYISLHFTKTLSMMNFNKEKTFLKAHWKNLALINYEIDAEVLEKHLPKGTEIDFYNGKCYVSLVGFLFQDTKLLGFKIPFHINFEEVNLRFYVKRFENNEWKRGVVFIKEIVPKHTLTLVANTIYKEHYQTLPMHHEIKNDETTTKYTYQWKFANKWNIINVKAKNELLPIKENSEAEFICEHYFGYTKFNKSTTFEYEVKHPRWEQYEVLNAKIDVDFKNVYGEDFANLENKKPCSVILAKGSEVSVENKRKLS